MSCSVVYWSEATSEPPKVVRTPSALNIFTSKCPSCHNGVHFFDIRTSKSGPNPWCVLCIFDFEMCFAPTTACTFFDISTSKSGLDLVCFVHFDLDMCFAPQRRALFRHLNFQKWSDVGVFCTFWLGNVLLATTACTFSTSQLPKVVRRWCALYILTWKCAFSPQRRALFRHLNFQKRSEPGVFLYILTWDMSFSPQRRALFRHLNFQKWSDAGVLFCTFWLGNVLLATRACTFSTSQLPKVVRTCFVLYILTWKCASRHNGVQFFISHLASWLRTRRFSEPAFRPSWAPNHWKKHSVSRLFLPFRASASSFFLLFLFYSSFFWSFSSLCLFPALLFICPYCRKFWLLNFLRLSFTIHLPENFEHLGMHHLQWHTVTLDVVRSNTNSARPG